MEEGSIRAKSPGIVTDTDTYQVKSHSCKSGEIRHVHSFLARTE